MSQADEAAIRQAFLDARTQNAWQPKDVPDEVLRRLVDIVELGPTSANCLPARFVFVKSPAAKEKLKPLLSEGNRAKTMQAPVCAIIGYDLDFYEHLPRTFPHKDMRSSYAGKPEKILETAFRNGTLQGGYLIIAARLLGLECGPMSGFDAAGVDAEFFAGTQIKSNFLCNLGYGDPSALKPRLPRFSFDEIAIFV
jgi:3-hydroxypropanoate dehydrogenase